MQRDSELLAANPVDKLVSLFIGLVGSRSHVSNPHLRGKLASVLHLLAPVESEQSSPLEFLFVQV